MSKTFEGAVFTQLNVEDYNAPNDGSKFVRRDFYKDPSVYHSVFLPYAQCSDVYVPCHFWDAKAPFIFTREDAKRTDFKLKLVADISCDIDCAVASTIRPSTIQNPLYGYNPITESEIDFMDEAAIGVMAVDNLPCELPRDASADFGAELIKHIMPSLLVADTDGIIKRATIAQNGQLCKDFLYLSDFVNG